MTGFFKTYRPLPLLCLLCTMGLLGFSCTTFASEAIGKVKTYEPTAKLIRDGQENYVFKGTEIFEGDMLTTDSDGVVGIIFDDGSVMTLGPSGKLVIENFLFKPAQKEVSFISKIIKGTVAFVSGTINRIKPGSVQFKTPTATLGLRGTKVLIEVK
jgi:hypothetical protein